MISGYHQQVADHYERHPYPSYPFFAWGRWSELSSVDLSTWQIEGPRQTAWIVGCGTVGPLMFGRRNPDVSFFASDLSEASLKALRRRLFLFGIHNVKTLCEDLIESRYESSFDAIDCYGVIHHMVSPAMALRKLSQALRPGGVLRLMVYSRDDRAEIERIRSEVVNRGLRDVKSIQTFLKESGIDERGDLASPAGLADALLNPIVHTFDDAAVENLLREVSTLKEMRRDRSSNYVLFLKKI